MIYLDPMVQNNLWFCDSRILTVVFWPLHLASQWNAEISPCVSWWMVQMISWLRKSNFSCALRRTKPHALSHWSNGCRSSEQDLMVEILFPFPRSLHPFWTSFPLWIRSQDKSYGLNGCSFHLRRVLYSCGRKIRESFKDLKEFHEFFVFCYSLWQIWANFKKL